MAYRYPNLCWNACCRDELRNGRRWFCPSCRYIGARAFAVGSFVAGVIAWRFR